MKTINIRIEWKRNYQWGWNPHLYLERDRKPIAKATGCGYDKESAVFADFLNMCLPGLLRLLKRRYKGKELPYGYRLSIDGGIHAERMTGMDCLVRGLKELGVKVKDTYRSRMDTGHEISIPNKYAHLISDPPIKIKG